MGLAMTMKQACIRAVLVLCVAATGTDAQSGDSAIAQRLDSIRKARNVPALGAAFIRGDGSVTSAVVGVRKRGTDVRATTEDKWPLASNTKAMTATLLATLVRAGRAHMGHDVSPRSTRNTGGIPRESSARSR